MITEQSTEQSTELNILITACLAWPPSWWLMP